MMIATKQTATLERVDALAGKALAGRGPTHA